MRLHSTITTGVVSRETTDIESKGPYSIADGNPVPEAKNIRWIND